MKKKLFIIIGMLLCLGVGVMGAYAYFSATTDQKENTMNLVAGSKGEVKGQIIEEKWNPASASDIVPRTVIEKDPKLKSEVPYESYAYIKVSVPQVNARKDVEEEKTFQDVVTFTANAGWTLIGETAGSSDGPHVLLYRYDTKLAANDSTGTLFDSVTVPDFKAAEGVEGNISVLGYMVQTTGITQAEADADAITWSGTTAK